MMDLFGSRYSKFESGLPDVSGKVFAITGTTSGTGFSAAACVAKHNGEVILLNRPSSRSKASLQKLVNLVPDGKFVAIDCDLQDFASVRKAAEEIKSRYGELYCLSNNAGIFSVPDEITVDGFDKQMQTNHLSHFLLCKELLPLLAKSAKEKGDARIVQHSSMARDYVQGNMLQERFFTKKEKDGMLGGNEDIGFMQGPKWERYYQTKLANSVFCQALHEKLAVSTKDGYRNILSLAAHPGYAKTKIADNLESGGIIRGIIRVIVRAFFQQTSEDGAMGLLKAMMDKKENVEGGTLYGPKFMTGYPLALPTNDWETDAASKEMLWNTSETAIGTSFDI